MNVRHPIIRLHLWLDTDDGMFFGSGRAQLLEGIERLGSLKKAAEEIGMSYRAAWGKIKQSEKMLGVQLIERVGDRREGYRLTEFGQLLKDKFMFWFDEVEKEALKKAQEIFPWPARSYRDQHGLPTLLPSPGAIAPDEEPAARPELAADAGRTPRGAAPSAPGFRPASNIGLRAESREQDQEPENDWQTASDRPRARSGPG